MRVGVTDAIRREYIHNQLQKSTSITGGKQVDKKIDYMILLQIVPSDKVRPVAVGNSLFV